MIAYECTTHPSNIKTWTLVGLWMIHLSSSGLDKFKVSEASFSFTPTINKNNMMHTIQWLLYRINERYAHMR